SPWNAPEPTTVSSAILSHCCAAFPGGNAAAALPAEPATTATATAVAVTTTTRSARALMTHPFRTADFRSWGSTMAPGLCADIARLCADQVVSSLRKRCERSAGISGIGSGRGRPRRRRDADRLGDTADAARAAPHAPKRRRVDGPDHRSALAPQSAGGSPKALVSRLEAAKNPPARRGGG